MTKENRVVIIGRPNVGKSTLANTISEKRTIVVSEIPGTTRDTIEKRIEWQENSFTLIDTGGLVKKETDLLQKNIQEKIALELSKASLILFVVDEKTGVVSFDREIAKKIRNEKKEIIVVINKVDSFQKWSGKEAFRKLGFKNIIPISALNGKGVGDLLDKIVEILPIRAMKNEKSEARFVFLGKQNVGKSSLSNALLKSNRSIESEVPGTTVDLIESDFTYQEKLLTMIDTAGLKRKAKAISGIEKKSQKKAVDLLKSGNVACFVIDASKRLSRQDFRIGQEIEESFLPTLIIVNKCDLLVPLDSSQSNISSVFLEKKREIREKIASLFFAKIIFVSAKEKFNLHVIPESILKIVDDFQREITQTEIDDFLVKFQMNYPAKSDRNRKTPKIFGLVKKSQNPLVFSLKVGKKGYLKQDYIRLMAKELHKELRIFSRPIRITINKKNENNRRAR